MTDDIEKIIQMNQRLNLILGYAMGFITKPPGMCKEDKIKYDWLIQAIENLLYLDKPLPPMP